VISTSTASQPMGRTLRALHSQAQAVLYAFAALAFFRQSPCRPAFGLVFPGGHGNLIKYSVTGKPLLQHSIAPKLGNIFTHMGNVAIKPKSDIFNAIAIQYQAGNIILPNLRRNGRRFCHLDHRPNSTRISSCVASCTASVAA